MLDDTKKIIISRDVTFEESIGVPKDEDKTQEDKMPVLLEDDTVEEHINNEKFQDPEDKSGDNNDDMHETEHQKDAEAEGAAPAPVPAAEPERRYPLRERRLPRDWFMAAWQQRSSRNRQPTMKQ
jgi:hypothetical protein